MSSDTQHKKQGKQSVEIQILGQRLVLKADADPRRLEHLAAYVKRKVDELSAFGPVANTKLALLAAINIADEYFRAAEDGQKFKQEVAKRSRALLAALDAAPADGAAPADVAVEAAAAKNRAAG